MKLETKLWCKIRDCKGNKSLFLQRIETSTGLGIPDLYFRTSESGWCELKVVESLYQKTKVRLTRKDFTISQRQWLRDHHESGGISMLCVGVYLDEKWEIFWLKGRDSYLFVQSEIEEIRKNAFHIGETFPTFS